MANPVSTTTMGMVNSPIQPRTASARPNQGMPPPLLPNQSSPLYLSQAQAFQQGYTPIQPHPSSQSLSENVFHNMPMLPEGSTGAIADPATSTSATAALSNTAAKPLTSSETRPFQQPAASAPPVFSGPLHFQTFAYYSTPRRPAEFYASTGGVNFAPLPSQHLSLSASGFAPNVSGQPQAGSPSLTTSPRNGRSEQKASPARGAKRKRVADYNENFSTSQNRVPPPPRQQQQQQQPPALLPSQSNRKTSTPAQSPAPGRQQQQPQQTQQESQQQRLPTQDSSTDSQLQPPASINMNNRAQDSVFRNHNGHKDFTDIPRILPHEKVFNIQIGNELFRLSGASISSDAPSYFTQFFEQELSKLSQAEYEGLGNGPGARNEQIKTLYIDRDPETFRDIARHLQGYYITPKDAQHFVRLFADAQFYSLPKLISQLFETDIYINIGGRPFQIPREVFNSPGDTQNFFSLGISINFTRDSELFPGLNREGLLRPPSIQPPNVPNRSGEVFAELLHMLRGYPIKIRDEAHRQELLRDCRYFLFKGLEQKLIAHSISWNPKRMREEIVLRIEDLKRSGISVAPDVAANNAYSWVNYARPFTNEPDRELILEIGGEATKIDWKTRRAEFTGDTKARVTALFQVVANKLNLPTNRALGTYMVTGTANSRATSPGSTPLSEDKVKIRIQRDCYITLDGEEYSEGQSAPPQQPPQAQPTDSEELPNAFDDSPHPKLNSPPSWPPGTASPSARGVASPTPNPAPGFSRRMRRRGSMDEMGVWIVKRGQWRLKVQDVPPTPGNPGTGGGKEIVLYGVKIEALSGEYGRNLCRGFLN